MKNTMKSTLIASLFALSAISAIAEDSTSTVYEWAYPTTSDLYWDNASNWTVGSSTATTVPGLTGDGSAENPYDSVVIEDLTKEISLKDSGAIYNYENLTIDGSDRIGLKTSSTSGQTTTINVQDTTTLDGGAIIAGGYLTFSSTNIELNYGLLSYIDSLTATNITNTGSSSTIRNSLVYADNVTVKAGTLLLYAITSGSDLGKIEIESSATLQVRSSSVFKTSSINGAGTLYFWNDSDSSITIDGGTGVLTGDITSNSDTNAYYLNINITNGANQSFIGAATDSYLNFTVDTDSKLTLSSAENAQVTLNGGTFEANTSGVALSKLSIASANSAIEFDLSKTSTDTATTAFLDVSEFSYSSDYLGTIYINLENITSLNSDYDYTLISFITADTNLTADSFTLMTLDGDEWVKYTEGEWAISMSDNSFILTSVAVPEPSTYALIFGTLALAFTYYRKRK